MNVTAPTRVKDIKRQWHIVDVKGKTLGRVASHIATLLIGKSKPYYVPHLDCGDNVVVINASLVEVTGKKASDKSYMRYSGYPSGLKTKTYADVVKTNPNRIIKEAVAGMLPNNKLRSLKLRRLYIFANEQHPYGEKLKISK